MIAVPATESNASPLCNQANPRGGQLSASLNGFSRTGCTWNEISQAIANMLTKTSNPPSSAAGIPVHANTSAATAPETVMSATYPSHISHLRIFSERGCLDECASTCLRTLVRALCTSQMRARRRRISCIPIIFADSGCVRGYINHQRQLAPTIGRTGDVMLSPFHSEIVRWVSATAAVLRHSQEGMTDGPR